MVMTPAGQGGDNINGNLLIGAINRSVVQLLLLLSLEKYSYVYLYILTLGYY